MIGKVSLVNCIYKIYEKESRLVRIMSEDNSDITNLVDQTYTVPSELYERVCRVVNVTKVKLAALKLLPITFL